MGIPIGDALIRFLLSKERETEKRMETGIDHFSHAHPLILRDETKNDEDKCSACKQPISGWPSYGCSECKEFVIHKSCAELPQQIQHPFHPLHPLTLFPKTPDDSGQSCCKGCGMYCSGFVYRCAACGFVLDVGCASLVPTFSYEGHDHLLTLFDTIHRNFWEDRKCNYCDTQCDSFVFRCVVCDFNLHKECAEFPKQILHPFHPLHRLSLSPKPISKRSWWAFWESDYCDACGKSCSGFVYNCVSCKFNLDLGCSKLEPSISYKHHEHLLTHFDESDTERSCYCCGKDGKTSFCRCVQCDFNVHKSCTELPGEIRHPFHGLHPLTLGDCPNPKRCDFCHRLGIEHPTLEPKKAFACVDCNFIVQIHCFDSLPLTIDHKCHVCPMTLTDSIVDEDNNSAEYYCDSCETERNPECPVYYCKECEFVAHINCVIPREVLSLPTLERKIKTMAEEAQDNLSSTLHDFTFNLAFERKFQGGDDANPAIGKLDEDIAKVCADIEAMVKKLENLKSERVALIQQVEAAIKEIT